MVTAEDLKILPKQPGVYLMKNAENKVLYVGKAINLKNRVSSYFRASTKHVARIRSMVSQVDHFEYITTASEVEALALECNLIKEFHPKYNVMLRDDKQYPWVKITLQETYPQVYITRQPRRDGSKYYGPYTNAGALRETLKMLHNIFPIRVCRHNLDREKIKRPCLNYHIKKCLAPCTGKVEVEKYREMIEQICLFLDGKQRKLAEYLKQEMQKASDERQYEKAAEMRDRLQDITKIMERQKVVAETEQEMDLFGIAQDREGSIVQIFQVREGKLVGREYFSFEAGDEVPAVEILQQFIVSYYDLAGVPREVLVSELPEDALTIEEWLTRQRGSKVAFRVPQRGEKHGLLDMAMENARVLLEQERHKESQRQNYIRDMLEELRQAVGIKQLPRRIEGFDISNIQGTEAVASMVVFEDGMPAGSEYRRFRIKTIEGPNDFAMMKEALTRRFRHGLEERQNGEGDGKFAKFPDLLLIDGGKGQLSSVVEVLEELGLADIAVLGLAKQEEEIYLPYCSEPIILSRRSHALMLLQRVRDEAHRFAITYHKNLRFKRTLRSELDDIVGIGPKKKQQLMKTFGSVKRIREAKIEELIQVPGITRELAETIKEQL